MNLCRNLIWFSLPGKRFTKDIEEDQKHKKSTNKPHNRAPILAPSLQLFTLNAKLRMIVLLWLLLLPSLVFADIHKNVTINIMVETQNQVQFCSNRCSPLNFDILSVTSQKININFTNILSTNELIMYGVLTGQFVNCHNGTTVWPTASVQVVCISNYFGFFCFFFPVFFSLSIFFRKPKFFFPFAFPLFFFFFFHSFF